MVAPATTVYFYIAGALSLAWLVTAAYALKTSGYTRRMLLVSAVPAASMMVAYILMGFEVATVETVGREQSMMRFVGYTAALFSFVYLLRESIGIPRREFLLLATAVVLTPWFSFLSWLFVGVVESLLTLGSLLAFAFAVYLMFRPLSRRANEIGGERQLFYAKLRNLFVLCYGTLVLLSALSEQVVGILDTFIATFGAGYADAILMYGIALLVLTSTDIFEQRIGEPVATAETSESTSEPPAVTDGGRSSRE